MSRSCSREEVAPTAIKGERFGCHAQRHEEKNVSGVRTADPLRQCIDSTGARDIVCAGDASPQADDDLRPHRLQHLEPALRS